MVFLWFSYGFPRLPSDLPGSSTGHPRFTTRRLLEILVGHDAIAIVVQGLAEGGFSAVNGDRKTIGKP